MRTVCFVDFAELEYQGNIFSKAIIAADVDNDNNNELVIGNVNGNLYVYKGLGPKPWAGASDLGMITCIEVGNVCNHGMNYLVSLNADGWCHIISVQPDASQESYDTNDVSFGEMIIRPAFKQRLTCNSKVLVIADIDGDGLNELVIGYTDRVVRSYKWTPDAAVTSSPGGQNLWHGKFVLTETWALAGQIGSMTVNKQGNSGKVNVMVSQPGGTFVTLICGQLSSEESLQAGIEQLQQQQQESSTSDAGGTDAASNAGTASLSSVIYHPLGSVRARNPGVTTEVVSNISRQLKGKSSESPNYSAICTLDGTLTLVDDDKILWSIYVDHQLFALTKLDITGDGMEEVVACSWDGQTYIVNLLKEVVRFHFRENVAAFCVGLYTIDKDRTVPCLFYATFNNKIVVYYNIRMSQVGTASLTSTIEQMKSDMLSQFNANLSDGELQKIYHWCLYGMKSALPGK